MTRAAVHEILRENNEQIVSCFGVRRPGLFGWHARDEAGPEGDVDLRV